MKISVLYSTTQCSLIICGRHSEMVLPPSSELSTTLKIETEDTPKRVKKISNKHYAIHRTTVNFHQKTLWKPQIPNIF